MQLTPDVRRRLTHILIIIVILNALTTLWLVQTVQRQSNRIEALERNDNITQSVQKLNTKVDGLKNRIEGLFH